MEIPAITANQIKGKVLFTGDNTNMIENLINYVPRELEILRCPANDVELSLSLERSMPHTLVICLAEDTHNIAQTYIVLQNSVKYADLPVVLVGRDEEYESFKAKVFVKNLIQYKRPINTDNFTQQLKENVAYYIEVYALPFAKAQAQKAAEQAAKAAAEKKEDNSMSDEKKASGFSFSEEELHKKIEQMSRKDILVVDDDVRMLNVIKLYLQDLYNVTIVPSGKLALKFLAKKKADLVLLDYLMPEVMGPEVLKEIRTNSPRPNVPVVFLTGVSDKELITRCLEYRPNGYLLKPISREALLERVTEVLLGIQ